MKRKRGSLRRQWEATQSRRSDVPLSPAGRLIVNMIQAGHGPDEVIAALCARADVGDADAIEWLTLLGNPEVGAYVRMLADPAPQGGH
jgi:hypothetical protein